MNLRFEGNILLPIPVATVTFEMDKYETMEDSMLRAFLVSNKQFQDDQLFVIGALNGTAFGKSVNHCLE